jgi:hypothetical protein
MMPYGLFAVGVALIHLGFILFVLFGGLLFFRWHWLAWLHLPSAIYAVLIMVVGWRCPLTDLEIWLRQQAGEVVEWSEFVHHYLWSHIGWNGGEWFITVGLLVVILICNWHPYVKIAS